MVKLINRQVPGLPRIPWATGKPSCIVLHDTANDSDRGQYEGERNYMANNWKNAFYHLIAGEDSVGILHDPARGGAWGAGPSMHNYAIHLELVHSNNKAGFVKAYNNWLGAAVHYMKKYGIPLIFNKGNSKRGVYTHYYVNKTWGGTTHSDPDSYLARWGVSIKQLEKDLTALYNGKDVAQSGLQKGELSVSEAKELNAKIAQLSKKLDAEVQKSSKLAKEIAELKKSKLNVQPSSQTADPSHAANWEWLRQQKITDGRNPHDYLTREQFGTLMRKFYDRVVSPDYSLEDYEQAAIDWAKEFNISDGSRPRDFGRRTEVLVMLSRLDAKLRRHTAEKIAALGESEAPADADNTETDSKE